MVFIIVFFISFIITIIFAQKNIKNNKKILAVYRFILEGISFTFFGQIFFGIITVFLCVNDNSSYYAQSIKCQGGVLYTIDSILGVISLIILLLMSFFFVSTFFVPNFLNNEINNALKKSNNCIDKSFFINKILITLLLYINQILALEWEIIIILLISTGIHLYIVFYYRSYEE